MKYHVWVALGWVMGLGACVGNEEAQLKKMYTEHYQQDKAKVSAYRSSMQGQSASQLAAAMAQTEQAQFKGRKRLVIDDYMALERVQSQGNQVVFDYTLTPAWRKLPIKAQNQQWAVLRQDVVYGNCASKTQRLLLKKDVTLLYRYQDKSSPATHELLVTQAICQQQGFH